MKKSVTPVGIVLCILICGLLAWLGALSGLPLVYALIELLLFGLTAYLGRKALSDGIFACVAVIAAVLFSLYDRIWAGGERSLFAPAAAVVTALMIGKYITDKITPEPVGRDTFSEVVPKTAAVLRDGAERKIPADEIVQGDIVAIRPGELVPCDGEIIAGRSEIDEKPITGELAAVLRSEGERVKAGSRNISGFLTVCADGGSELERMIMSCCEMSEEKRKPSDRKPAILRGLTVSAISLMISAIVFAASGIFEAAFAFALTFAAICPCASGISRTLSYFFASKKAASEGVRFCNPSAIDAIRRTDVAVVDLNGTATVGKLSVSEVVSLGDMNTQDIIRVAAALCDEAEGADFVAIKERCILNGVAVPPCIACERLVGVITGTVDGRRAKLSSLREDCEYCGLAGKLLKTLFLNDEAVGVIAISDSVKPNAVSAVKALSERGIRTVLITGMSESESEDVISKIGADELRCGLSAEKKCETVTEIQKSRGAAAVIADGVSDCSALTAADCGFALGSGAEAAKKCASAVLLRNDLRDILPLIDLSASAARCAKAGFIASETVRAAAFAASGIAAVLGAYAVASAVCAAGILLAPATAAIFASQVGFGKK